MSDILKLVQNDTLPTVYVSLIDQVTALPLDISTATSISLAFRAIGATTLTDTLFGTKVAGLVNPDGSITSAGYTVAGTGGRCSFNWNGTTLATVGAFEGSVTVTFPGGVKQTVYETLRFQIRASF